jgi:ABC-type transporter Mla maintaining outer membrane lipid asymmetry ATPase subunit MlaF
VEAERDKCEEAEFLMLRNGDIVFEGNATQLRNSADPYLRSFLT